MKKIVSIVLIILICVSLFACGKSDAAKAFEEMVNGIGSVSLDSEEAIAVAENAYQALTDKDRSAVKNSNTTLVEKRAEYQTLREEAEQKARFDELTGLIDAVGTVSLDSQEAIIAAEEAYSKFSEPDITEVIDTYYKDVEHCVVYDEQNSVLLIIIEGMDNLRTYLSTNTKELLESWNSVADGTESLCGSIFEAVNVGNYAKHVRIYWVDSINSTNTYTKAETLLFAEDGEIVYNIVDDIESSVQITIPQQNTTVNDNISFGERNALEMAEEYLAVMPFSYSGLIEQLEYEGFSTSESVFAADHCTADWYLQAVMMAEDYLDVMSFSKSELIEQLEYEGFTHDQAVYGADKAY